MHGSANMTSLEDVRHALDVELKLKDDEFTAGMAPLLREEVESLEQSHLHPALLTTDTPLLHTNALYVGSRTPNEVLADADIVTSEKYRIFRNIDIAIVVHHTPRDSAACTLIEQHRDSGDFFIPVITINVDFELPKKCDPKADHVRDRGGEWTIGQLAHVGSAITGVNEAREVDTTLYMAQDRVLVVAHLQSFEDDKITRARKARFKARTAAASGVAWKRLGGEYAKVIEGEIEHGKQVLRGQKQSSLEAQAERSWEKAHVVDTMYQEEGLTTEGWNMGLGHFWQVDKSAVPRWIKDGTNWIQLDFMRRR